MKRLLFHRLSAARGFTLVESIIALVVLGIAAAAIMSLQGTIFNGLSSGKDMEVGAQLVQECAEQILATRRNGSSPAGGFGGTALVAGNPAVAATALCSGMTISGPPTSYGAPTVKITDGNNITANMGACPFATGSNCKLVSITQGGLTPVTLLLVSY